MELKNRCLKTDLIDILDDQKQNSVMANQLEFNASRLFSNWMLEHNISLSFTTYQAGKLFFIGTQAQGQLSVFERSLA